MKDFRVTIRGKDEAGCRWRVCFECEVLLYALVNALSATPEPRKEAVAAGLLVTLLEWEDLGDNPPGYAAVLDEAHAAAQRLLDFWQGHDPEVSRLAAGIKPQP